jgi:uncharacterized membrane protein
MTRLAQGPARRAVRIAIAGLIALLGVSAGGAPSADARNHGDVRTPSPAFVLDRGRFTTFDAPGAVVETAATGIDDAGRIVGGYVDADRRSHGYVRDRKGRFTVIDVPWASTANTSALVNFPGSAATDVNDRRQLVGTYTGRDGKARGYLLERGRLTRVDVAGAFETVPFGTGNRRDVVGTYVAADGRLHGFLRDRLGTVETIDVPGAEGTVVLDVNNRRQVAGTFADADGGSHGFVLDDGRVTRLDFPGTTGKTGATGIDAFGRIVGQYVDDTGAAHGFLRDSRGRFTTIDVPGAAGRTAPVHPNDLGQIVGSFQRG